MDKTPTVRPRSSNHSKFGKRTDPRLTMAANALVESLETRRHFSAGLLASPAAIVANNNVWQSIGPQPLTNGQVPGGHNVSGRVTGIAADPTDGNTYYVTTGGGGVWKTTNGGTDWANLTDNLPTLITGSIAIAPTQHTTIYVGTGEGDLTTDSFYGDGVLKSTNSGLSWTLLGSDTFFGQTISKIVVDPTNPNIVYAAVSSDGVNGATAPAPLPSAVSTSTTPGQTVLPSGIYKSVDGGLNWVDTTLSLTTDDFFTDVAINPQNPSVVYASFFSTSNGQSGVYETVDGGQTYTLSGDFPSTIQFGRISLAIAPNNPDTIYASIENNTSGDLGGDLTVENPGLVAITNDGGQTWFALQGVPLYSNGQGFFDNNIIVDPSNPDVFYLGGSTDGTTDANGNFLNAYEVSHDGGSTFTDITVGSAGNNGPGTESHAFAFDAAGRLLVGSESGIWRLDNANTSAIAWTDINGNLNTDQQENVALDPENVNHVFAGDDSNGNDFYNGSIFKQVTLSNGGYVAIDPTNSNILYASTSNESTFFLKSTNGGTSFTAETTNITSQAEAAQFPVFTLDPNNHNRLLLGTDQVYESLNGATTWTAISTPGSGGWNVDAPITAIAVQKGGPNGETIYAAAGGTIFYTRNDGSNWSEIDPPSYTNVNAYNSANGTQIVPPAVDKIVIDSRDSRIAYAVVDGFATLPTAGLLPVKGNHIYETINTGTTWNDISGNLPNVPYHTIALLPTGCERVRPHAVHRRRRRRVFVSYDDGYVLEQVTRAGLPNVQVTDLEVDPTHNILAAATYGRGTWEVSTVVPRALPSGTKCSSTPTAPATELGQRSRACRGRPSSCITVGADGHRRDGRRRAAPRPPTATTTGTYRLHRASRPARTYLHAIPPSADYHLSPVRHRRQRHHCRPPGTAPRSPSSAAR